MDEIIGDTEGSLIHDHAFEPRLEEVGAEGIDNNREWTYILLPINPYLCKHCRLAEAAHATKEVG